MKLAREGIFRAWPQEKALRESKKSGALQLSLKVMCSEEYEGNDENGKPVWKDISTEAPEVYGDLVLISGNGQNKPNEEQVKAVAKAFGWTDGNLETLDKMDVVNTCIQVTVKKNDYNGNTSYRIDWVRHYEEEPRQGMRSLDTEKVGSWQDRVGSSLRAIVSSIAPQAPAPTNAPAPMPKRESATVVVDAEAPEGFKKNPAGKWMNDKDEEWDPVTGQVLPF